MAHVPATLVICRLKQGTSNMDFVATVFLLECIVALPFTICDIVSRSSGVYNRSGDFVWAPYDVKTSAIVLGHNALMRGNRPSARNRQPDFVSTHFA